MLYTHGREISYICISVVVSKAKSHLVDHLVSVNSEINLSSSQTEKQVRETRYPINLSPTIFVHKIKVVNQTADRGK